MMPTQSHSSCRQCGYEGANFYASNKSRCKECVKVGVRANRQANIDHYRIYDRKRAQAPHRVKARKEYSVTDVGRHATRRAKAAYIERNPVKRKANSAVRNALRDGKISRPNECSHCLKECVPHGHHEDYGRPLDVIWLCDECHAQLHAFYVTVGRSIPF